VKTYQNREKIVITTTLLVNPATGEKLMSKSLGTGIGLDLSPEDMYGKTMALPDEAIIQVFIDCTFLPMDEINKMKKDLESGTNPRDLKMKLAYEIVKTYHSEREAKAAQENFINIFQKKQGPSVEVKVIKIKNTNIIDAMTEIGFTPSRSEAKRLIEQGGVKVDDKVVSDINYSLIPGEHLIQKGKRFFAKVIVS
ncbi:MAG: tyrosine--tRNA ligase, partial [Patescibacteria group bacterium]|nr:tyrosine--tRNA ligase [Patescibacteria group bacterium]